jgi:hypothetical protein
MGLPRTCLGLVGLVLVLAVLGAGKSYALMGLVLIMGVAMIVVSVVWSLVARRRRRET